MGKFWITDSFYISSWNKFLIAKSRRLFDSSGDWFMKIIKCIAEAIYFDIHWNTQRSRNFDRWFTTSGLQIPVTGSLKSARHLYFLIFHHPTMGHKKIFPGKTTVSRWFLKLSGPSSRFKRGSISTLHSAVAWIRTPVNEPYKLIITFGNNSKYVHMHR